MSEDFTADDAVLDDMVDEWVVDAVEQTMEDIAERAEERARARWHTSDVVVTTEDGETVTIDDLEDVSVGWQHPAEHGMAPEAIASRMAEKRQYSFTVSMEDTDE